jgi:hypothetical protein
MTTPTTSHRIDSGPTTRQSTPRLLTLALALVAPLAPLAVGLGDILVPQPDESGALLDEVGANPGLASAAGAVALVAVLFFVPGVLAAGLAALRGAPRLASAGLLIAVPGWSAAFVFPDLVGLANAMTSTGIDRSSAVRVLDHLGSFASPSLAVAVMLFVVGHIVGTVLLGLALWRSRAVPRAIAGALTVSQPLHFVAFVILGNDVLDGLAYLLTALGFGAAGWAVHRAARQD